MDALRGLQWGSAWVLFGAFTLGCGDRAGEGGAGAPATPGQGGGAGTAGTSAGGAGTTGGAGLGGGDAGASASAGNASLGGAGAGAGGGSGGSDGGGGSGGATADSCPSPTPPDAPLRRLNRFEYNRTVDDLFGDDSRPADALPQDTHSNAVDDNGITPLLAEGYHRLAHDFALRVTSDPALLVTLLGCDPEAEGEDTCRDRLIQDLVARIFRRPLEPTDVTDFEDVFATGVALGGDFASGVRAVLEVALQAPEFLYRIELGEPADDRGPGWARPTPYEMATRLSYLYRGSTPDPGLMAAAEGGELTTPAQIEAQAARLLAQDPVREVVRYFYFQLLDLHGITFAAAGSTEHPTFTPEIGDLLLHETELFVDDVTWESPGTFEALFTTPETWLNADLAAFYGVDGPSGPDFQRVTPDPAQRAGLLTQASFLAGTSHSTGTSPVQRGLFVFRTLLCGTLPAAPPDVSVTLPPEPDPGATTRERFEQHLADPVCAECHAHFDPLGFAFEHYDAAGLWRDTENGRAIDATGEIFETDVSGPFDGAVELSQKIAQSMDARRCYIDHWFTFAYGRAASPDADACTSEALVEALTASDGVRDLLLALSQTESFLYRPEVTP